MYINKVLLLLVTIFIFPANAFSQTPGQPTVMGQFVAMMPMLLMIIAIFYFLVVLPQKKEYKRHQDFLTSLKKGSDVVTASGIIARVASVEKDHILLEIATNVKVKFEPSQVVKPVESAPAKNDK